METENKTQNNEIDNLDNEIDNEDASKIEDEDQFVEVQLDNVVDDKVLDTEKTDEELWDPSAELDDVSLLDEFAEELEELEKSEKEKKTKDGEDLSEILNLDESLKSDEKKVEEEEDLSPHLAPPEERESKLSKFLPIAISAVSFAFLVAGIYVFFTLFKGVTPTSAPTPKETPKVEKHEPKKTEEKEEPKVETKPQQQVQLPHFESLPLSSFIIPAVQNGQLVFLNLQITLLVPDEATKKQLQQRETRIRDAIYRELKGVDVSKGVSENTLIMLRKPIIDKLNAEISPLRVEDIRISGYILK